MTTPLPIWLGFHLFLLALLAAELLYARRRVNRPPVRTPASAHRTAVVATIGGIEEEEGVIERGLWSGSG